MPISSRAPQSGLVPRPGRAARGLAAAAVALALAACAKPAGPGAAPASSGAPATASASASARAGSTPPASSCNRDYCTPADWDTARASTPLPAIPPFVEPLNVIVSARSTVSLAGIQQALGSWKTVSVASSVSVAGIKVKCISSESANVTGAGYAPQDLAWRLAGCLGGNTRSLSGTEDHVRLWHQPVPGSAQGAWFAAASIETMCVAPHGTLEPAAKDKAYAIVHSSGAYHCVNGGPGTLTGTYANGYEDGARVFAAAVAAAGRARGWTVAQRVVTRPAGSGVGEGGVRFSGNVIVLTVTSG
ncbi:MAG TPA: hypothetical protein VH478_23310 [Trebonia sp.]|jgi:hypothetical protein|nr:hypothetical protein [Trebonia sp.]